MAMRSLVYSFIVNNVDFLGSKPETPFPATLDYQFQNGDNYNFQDGQDFDFN